MTVRLRLDYARDMTSVVAVAKQGRPAPLLGASRVRLVLITSLVLSWLQLLMFGQLERRPTTLLCCPGARGNRVCVDLQRTALRCAQSVILERLRRF